MWAAINQIELHPDFSQAELREWHEIWGIVTECWSPLGRGELLKNDVIERLASRHGRSAAQIVLRWHVRHGLVAIPKSHNPERMRENLGVFDFQLDAQEMAIIDTLGGGRRQGGDPDTCEEE